MGTTPSGYPYPEPSDAVAQGADAIKALALAVDGAAGKSASGTVQIKLTNAATGQMAITFPPGRFTAAPLVVATPVGSFLYCAAVGAPVTAAGCNILLFNRDGTSSNVTLNVNWTARSAG